MAHKAKKIMDSIKASKAKRHGRSSNDIIMNSLFPEAEKPIDPLLEKVNRLAGHIGLPHGDGLNAMEILDNLLAKLGEVPYIPYPVSFSTVDMVPIFVHSDGRKLILLGRKHNQTQYQFCGGFRDPMETIEEAASRELSEEASIIVPPSRFHYEGSIFVDDRRYANSPHKITTSMLTVTLTASEAASATGGDDIADVAWFGVDYLALEWEKIVRPVHQGLLRHLFSWLFPDIELKQETLKDYESQRVAPEDVPPGDV